jgi:hypothetical protein
MLKSVRSMTIVAFGLAVPAVLDAAPLAQPDLRPLLVIQFKTAGTDSPTFSDDRITIYRGGALLFQAEAGNPACTITTLALGPGLESALAALSRALRIGQVGIQRDCGLGLGFGTNLEYQLEWRGKGERVNRFKFGTFYQSSCPAGVALIKDAVDAYLVAVMNDPRTKVIRSNPCSP